MFHKGAAQLWIRKTEAEDVADGDNTLEECEGTSSSVAMVECAPLLTSFQRTEYERMSPCIHCDCATAYAETDFYATLDRNLSSRLHPYVFLSTHAWTMSSKDVIAPSRDWIQMWVPDRNRRSCEVLGWNCICPFNYCSSCVSLYLSGFATMKKIILP